MFLTVYKFLMSQFNYLPSYLVKYILIVTVEDTPILSCVIHHFYLLKGGEFGGNASSR